MVHPEERVVGPRLATQDADLERDPRRVRGHAADHDGHLARVGEHEVERDVTPMTFSGGPAHSGCRISSGSGSAAGICSKKLIVRQYPARGRLHRRPRRHARLLRDHVLLLGVFSKRSARDYLDWKPTRSPEVEAQNEIDDIEQMIAAQNELAAAARRSGDHREEIEERWRES